MRSEHKEHLLRSALILVLFLALGAAWAFGSLDDAIESRLEGVLMLLGPALLDSLNVARRHTGERKEMSQDFSGEANS